MASVKKHHPYWTILEHSVQVISAKALRQNLNVILKKVTKRSIYNLVVTINRKPVAVILNGDAYEEMLDQLEILRLEAAAGERLLKIDNVSLISLVEMRSRFDKDHNGSREPP